jgi:glycosyltransferase involved in cell wall biosynthesis
MKQSIIIPCYNEEKNIPLILKRFGELIKDEDIEVILVNNGSTDKSQSVLDDLIPQYGFSKTVLVGVNQGYGYGILQGLKEARGEYIGWTHADMQTDPADVLKAYGLIENNASSQLFIKGNRKNRPLFDVIFTKGMSLFESLYLGKRLTDINAQPTIFPREFFNKWKKPPYDFSLDLYAYYMAHVHHLEIIRFPVLFPERIHGQSSWNTGLASKWKFIKRTLKYSVNLKKEGIS